MVRSGGGRQPTATSGGPVAVVEIAAAIATRDGVIRTHTNQPRLPAAIRSFLLVDRVIRVQIPGDCRGQNGGTTHNKAGDAADVDWFDGADVLVVQEVPHLLRRGFPCVCTHNAVLAQMQAAVFCLTSWWEQPKNLVSTFGDS